MIRLFLLLAALLGLIYIFNWMTSYDGQILLQVGEYEITTSIVFFIIISISIITFSIITWVILSYLYSLPKKIQKFNQEKKKQKIQDAITRGLVYASSGNSIAADAEIKKIDRLIKDTKETKDIMTLVLKAQNASLKKDRNQLNKIFQTMGDVEETKMLSYRGLYTLSKNSKNTQKSIEILKDAETYNPALTLVFGLIHGFGFASVLLELGLPKGKAISSLFGFNLGVEFGQILVVTLAISTLYVLGKTKLIKYKENFYNISALFLIALGTFWFVGRVFSL